MRVGEAGRWEPVSGARRGQAGVNKGGGLSVKLSPPATSCTKLRPCCRHVAARLVSTSKVAAPLAVLLPHDSLRVMTAGRSCRSARLFVGYTPGTRRKGSKCGRCLVRRLRMRLSA